MAFSALTSGVQITGPQLSDVVELTNFDPVTKKVLKLGIDLAVANPSISLPVAGFAASAIVIVAVVDTLSGKGNSKQEEALAAMLERNVKLENNLADMKERNVKLENNLADMKERNVKLENNLADMKNDIAEMKDKMDSLMQTNQLLLLTIMQQQQQHQQIEQKMQQQLEHMQKQIQQQQQQQQQP